MSWEKVEAEVKNKVYPIECLAGDYGWFLIDKRQYARFVESVAKDSYKLIEKLI